MRRLTCLALLFLLHMLSVAATAATDERPVIKVGFYEFPPSIYTDAAGNAKGPLVDFMQRMIERAGYQPQFRSMPSARLYNGLIDGSVHLWAGAVGKPSLKDHTLETARTLSAVTMNLYFRPDTPTPRIPQDLVGRNVILISGYTYWPSVSQLLNDPALAIATHTTSTHTAAVEMLLRRRGDYIINYKIPVSEALREMGESELPFVILEHMPIRYIISKKAPNAWAIRDALDLAYDQMRAAGENLQLP